MHNAGILRAVAAAALALGGLAGCRGGGSPANPVTFNQDVAPILYDKCAACHRAGGDAPFPLTSYEDAVKHAQGIAEETRKHHMPPWLPDGGDFAVLGERRLTDSQIATLQQWVDTGRVEGTRAPGGPPAPPVFPDGWQLGRPDVVVAPAQPYTLKPGGDDVYRNLVVHAPVSSDVFVRAVEFRTNGAPIHHAVIRVDRTRSSRARDGADGQPGFEGMTWQNAQDPEGQFIGWAPGRGPIVSPDGMPWRLNGGADLVVELHMLRPKKPVSVTPSIGLFFSTAPPRREPLALKMSSKLIDIPPGAKDYAVTETFELPVAVELMSVYPHAHYLGKDMLVTATWPDGTTRTLLHIPHWSFHWQQDYRYATPIALPRGTAIRMRYTYDNSADNEDNPRQPPVRVRLGPNSTDEMGELGLQVLTASVADSLRLMQAAARLDMRANIALGEARVREQPTSAEYQAFLGKSYLEVDRSVDALPHLEAAVRLDPKSAAAEGDLGSALLAQNRAPEAVVHLLRATALAPRDEVIQFNLGNALSHQGRATEAAAAYGRALALSPDFAEAHVNLGTLLFRLGRPNEALPHLRRATELLPNSAVVHSDYASVLAASGRYAEALAETRRSLELNPDYAPARENLARLQQMGIK